MRRRELLKLLVLTAAWPHTARAQPSNLPVIGFVNAAFRQGYARPLSSFLKGLDESGFVEGRNVDIEYRWAEGDYERLPALVSDLVSRKVNVIAATSTPAALAAKAATSTIPIVFTTSGDPIRLGLVPSLNSPGGNVTGATQLNEEVAPKRLELVHQLLPAATHVGLLVNPTNALANRLTKELDAAAASLGIQLTEAHASTEPELAQAFEALIKAKADALVIGTDVFFNSHSEEIAALALKHRIPSIYQYHEFTSAGGLISYGGNVTESYRLAGLYVGRILKGERPANLPVQQVTKVELIINLKTAKALGVTFPISLLGRADEVIE